MKEKVSSYLYGAVRIVIVGENKERFVNLCRSSGLYVWDIRKEKDCTLCISVSDFFQLKPVVKKTAVKIKILEKYGIPFLLYQYRKRSMFFAGIAVSFCLIYGLSRYIWNLEIVGNFSHSDYEISALLKEISIKPGIAKKELDCDKIEKEIRNHYFDITWVSVEVSGTRLIVHIKENEENLQEKEKKPEVTEGGYDLVAEQEAVVTEVVMRSGTPAVKAGMEVKPGDILVYGHYDVVNDSNEVVRTQYLLADADIYGKVVYSYEEELPFVYQKKEYEKDSKVRFSIRIGDKLFKITDNKKEQEEVMTEENQLSIYGNFFLPVYVIKSTYHAYQIKDYIYSEEQAKSICEEKLAYFIEKLEKNTIQIVENNVTIESDGEVCRSSGTITVIENIGKLQKTVVQEDMTGETVENYE